MTPRTRLTDKQKLELFVEQNGRCIICGQPIKSNGSAKTWDAYDIDDLRQAGIIDEHREPLWRAGSNDLSNRGIAHASCATVKTSKEATERAKGGRLAIKYSGLKRESTFRKPPPGMKRNWRTGRMERVENEDGDE